MLYKYQYSTPEEKENLITDHSSLILVEEQNITEGNFLIFSDEPLPEKTIYMTAKEELDYLKNTTDLILLKQEGIL